MTGRPTFPVTLDAAQREQLARAAARLPVSGGALAPDVDVDAVIGRQLTQGQLAELTPPEVHAARREGRLLGLMTPELAGAFTPPTPAAAPGSLTRDELQGMTPHAIMEAGRAGQLDHLLAGGEGDTDRNGRQDAADDAGQAARS